jgi:hypothetical protein
MCHPPLLGQGQRARYGRRDVVHSAGDHIHPRTYFSSRLLTDELKPAAPEGPRPLPHEGTPHEPSQFCNRWSTDIDATSRHAFLRHLPPERYVELADGALPPIRERRR